MEMFEILERLCGLPGPSGREAPVAEASGAMLMPYVDRVEFDRLGNLLCFRSSGRVRASTLLLDAHLDEIGFVVTGHDEGYLRFSTVGGVDSRVLPGTTVLLLCADPPVKGVVVCPVPHLLGKQDSGEAIPLSELLIDIGMPHDKATLTCPVGTRAVFGGGVFPLGPGQISGHALDNRVGFAVLLRTMELLAGHTITVDLAVLGSVQEEVGMRGAKTAAFTVLPDSCIVVDVTHAHSPGTPPHKTFKPGGGPCIGMGPGCHRAISSALLETAQTGGIPHQVEVMEGNTGTNAWPVQVTGRGVATAVLSVPLRYMHTPVETVHTGDIENTARLLSRYILSLEGEV